jgi:uncharacterized protein YjcR
VSTHADAPPTAPDAAPPPTEVTPDEMPLLPADAQRVQARALYWQGWRVTEIARLFGCAKQTVQSWKSRDGWDDARPIDRVAAQIEVRMVQLVNKPQKSGGDFKEIDLLGRQLERLARIGNYAATGKESDLNPNRESKAKGKPAVRKTERNFFSEEQIEQVQAAFREGLFEYQHLWRQNRAERTRMILKSRQIGATWYFAREALVKALETGHNQIFLSASKAQAHIFKSYIQGFAHEACGVELSGDPIVLANGAHLYFLGNNARTAQGYHGDFYFDEFFWSMRFEELNKVASAMALHKKWRKTYFSTPSSINHEAFPLWSGERFNRKRPKEQQAEINTGHTWLAPGHVAADRIWRNIVTIEDAIAGGFDLVDLDELRLEYAPDEYDNLLMCQFIDDTYSVFPLGELRPCMVDSWDEWADVKPFAARPYGFHPVWLGYDPSHTGDTAGCAVVAPPLKPGGVFRVLERLQFKGMDFEAQAREIKKITQRYHVAYMGIDTTGIGQGVYQLVRKFFPQARSYNYSVDVKTRLVLKAKSVITSRRLQFDASWVEMAHAFLSIKRVLTGSGKGVTYDAGRNAQTGHADLAWAVMHALDNEPLDGQPGGHRNIMEMYG